MAERILITGSTGFVGRHLVTLLAAHQYALFGIIHGVQSEAADPAVHYFTGDLLDLNFCKQVVTESKPEFVIHLAAQSSVAVSWQDPHTTIANNVNAQLNLLEALRQTSDLKKVLVISSADVYGSVKPDALPITELNELRPVSPYATSKVLQEELGFGYYLSYHLPVVRLRPFGHIGPRQTGKTAIASFVEKIVASKDGGSIGVGNLDITKDFTDVRDIVAAYHAALTGCANGDVYNIGSGTSYVLRDVLQQLIALSKKHITVTTDESLYRPNDIIKTVCDNTKFVTACQWRPKISMEQTLKDMMAQASAV